MGGAGRDIGSDHQRAGAYIRTGLSLVGESALSIDSFILIHPLRIEREKKSFLRLSRGFGHETHVRVFGER